MIKDYSPIIRVLNLPNYTKLPRREVQQPAKKGQNTLQIRYSDAHVEPSRMSSAATATVRSITYSLSRRSRTCKGSRKYSSPDWHTHEIQGNVASSQFRRLGATVRCP